MSIYLLVEASVQHITASFPPSINLFFHLIVPSVFSVPVFPLLLHLRLQSTSLTSSSCLTTESASFLNFYPFICWYFQPFIVQSSSSPSSPQYLTLCCTDLPPAGWGVYLDAAPSAWRSRARRSESTTSPSSCSGGLCTGRSAGWTGCGSIAAAGSWPPRAAGPGWAGLDSVGLFEWMKKKKVRCLS